MKYEDATQYKRDLADIVGRVWESSKFITSKESPLPLPMRVEMERATWTKERDALHLFRDFCDLHGLTYFDMLDKRIVALDEALQKWGEEKITVYDLMTAFDDLARFAEATAEKIGTERSAPEAEAAQDASTAPAPNGKQFHPAVGKAGSKQFPATPEGLRQLIGSIPGEKEKRLATAQAILAMYEKAEFEGEPMDLSKMAACLDLGEKKKLNSLKKWIHDNGVSRPGEVGNWNQIEVESFFQKGEFGADVRELVGKLDLRAFTKRKSFKGD